MNEFGEKIRELRGKESLRKASKGIGISHTYLDSLEKGFDPRTHKERKPTIEVLHKISKYYDYDLFELSRLSKIFISLSNLPDEVKEKEEKRIREQFSEYINNSEIKIKRKYLELMSKDLNYDEVIFFQNLYNFYLHEKDGDNLIIDGKEDTTVLIYVASIFKVLTNRKNDGDEKFYKETLHDIDKFLKGYLNIK